MKHLTQKKKPEPNKALERTVMAVTDHAPSLMLRASHHRRSAWTLGQEMRAMPRYFPAGLFGPNDQSLARSVERDLSALLEGPLLEKEGKPPLRVYRFTWIRAFHPAIAVKVSFGPHLPAVVRVGRLVRDHLFPAFPRTNAREKDLLDEDTESLILSFRAVGFRDFPPYLPEPGVTLDGAMWIIEAVEPEFYHAVYRHSPESSPFRMLGLKFLELAGLEGEEIY